MPNSKGQLIDFLQQSYVDNSGNRHRVGKGFRAAVELAGRQNQPGMKYCEPVQTVECRTSELKIELLCCVESISVKNLVLENEVGMEMECLFRYDATLGIIVVSMVHDLDFGYYYLNIELLLGRRKILVRQLIICSPRSAWHGNTEQTRNVMAVQLYALRSTANWGIGDFGDLKKLAMNASRAGHCYIALNPMHMTHFSQVGECSPYSPVSRLLLNWLYIDITALDVYREDKSRLSDTWPFEDSLDDYIEGLRRKPLVDYKRVVKVKFWVLSELAKSFWHEYEGGRKSNLQYSKFDDFLRVNQQRILGQIEAHCDAAHTDPQAQQFHLFTQYCCKLQLQDCFPKDGGIQPIYDLAIGVKADSIEVLADPECYVSTMSIGAPPDAFNKAGQCWNIAPFNPVVLRDRFYLPLIELLQVNMPMNGGIRIDHVMWLARQFWIEAGASAIKGGYVRFPVDEVLAILRLESVRRNCIVIGEDLGTVPPGFRKLLTGSGVFLMDVLPFSAPEVGHSVELENYPKKVAAFVGTHDMLMFAAIWDGKLAGILMELGLTPKDQIANTETHMQNQKTLFEDVIGNPGTVVNSQCGLKLLNARLRDRNPAFHFSLLDDVVGEIMPINIPGTIDEYPNWQRKHAVLIEDLVLAPV